MLARARRLAQPAALAALAALGLAACRRSSKAPPAPAPTASAAPDPLPEHAVRRLGRTAFVHPEVRALAFDPQGDVVSISPDAVVAWDRGGRERRRVPIADRGVPTAISPDARAFISARFDVGTMTLRVREAESGRDLATFTDSTIARPWDLALANGGRRIFAAGEYFGVRVYEAGAGVRTRTGHTPLAATPDGRVAAAGYDDVEVWDAESGARLTLVRAPSYPTHGKWQGLRDVPDHAVRIALSPDGSTVAVVYETHPKAKIVRVATGEERSFELPWGRTSAIALPRPDTLIVADWDRGVEVRDAATGDVRRAYRDREAGHVAVSHDGRTLAATNGDLIRLWDLETGAPIAPHAGHLDRLVAVASAGNVLLTAGTGDVRRWDASGASTILAESQTRRVLDVALSPDGALAAVAEADAIHLVDTRTGAVRRSLTGNHDSTAVTFSPDGKRLVAALHGNLVAWELSREGSEPRTLSRSSCRRAGFDATGARLLATCHDQVAVYDGATLAPIATVKIEGLERSPGPGFFPDGRAVAVPDGDQVTVWALPDATRERSIAFPDRVNAVAVAPSGRRFAVALDDGSVRVLDRAGTVIADLRGHRARVTALAWISEDRLVSGSDDTTAVEWRI